MIGKARLNRLMESEREKVKADGLWLSHEFYEWIQSLPDDERPVFYRYWWHRKIEACDNSPEMLALCGGTFEEQAGDSEIFKRIDVKFPDDFVRRIMELDKQATALDVRW